MASVTAGLKCAPEMGPNVKIRVTSIAPVAAVLASKAMATLPPASFSPMIPEPTIAARSKPVPKASAARRRDRDIKILGTAAWSATARYNDRFSSPDEGAHEFAFDFAGKHNEIVTGQASPCVLNTVNPRWLDPDAVESDLGEFGYIVVIGESACDTTHPQFKAFLNFGRNVSSDNHIGNRKTATGSKHPKCLLKHAVLFTCEIDHAIRDDDVNRIARKGNVLDVSSEELDIGEAALALVFFGEGKHLVCHVETIRFAIWTNPAS